MRIYLELPVFIVLVCACEPETTRLIALFVINKPVKRTRYDDMIMLIGYRNKSNKGCETGKNLGSESRFF